jgi:chemotaxis protein MotB
VSSGEDESNVHELVIIRRRHGGEDEGHHGGVWKIAYADFMTAMMAFFLVMWLINATDKKVITQVANYFNPLRLTDKVVTNKGLQDADTGGAGPGKSPASGNAKEKDAKTKSTVKSDASKDSVTEEALFRNPYDVLARLAAQARSGVPSEQPAPNAGAPRNSEGLNVAGEAFRDPFDPSFRQGQPRPPSPDAVVKETRPETPTVTAVQPAPVLPPDARPDSHAAAAPSRAADGDPKSEPQPTVERREADRAAGKDAAAKDPASPPMAKPLPKDQPDAAEPAPRSVADASQPVKPDAAKDEAGKPRDAANPGKGSAEAAAEASKLAEQIKQALSQMTPGLLPHIDVTVTDEGILLSLTDEYNFGMFAVASAEPRPATVVVMEKVAKVLQGMSGQLIVRGHTDGRPFRSATYDNWRLSTARAHMAYYMLVRGGIPEGRFDRVEGYADHSLRVPNDPEAAQNRRIEILVRKPKT